MVEAKEVYTKLSRERSFEAALTALEGIVISVSGKRLFARHELYVRHLVDNVVGLDQLIDCLIGILATFTKYAVPVVKHINRIDSLLFRFCLNHDFLKQQCMKRSLPNEGERLYTTFEIQFQLDGHFWLQYGLYLSACCKNDDALIMLERSIKAYPNNPFAVHAHAEMQLKIAEGRRHPDEVTSELISQAVKTLLELHAKGENTDQYPMVTLANYHVGALIKYKQIDAAKNVARQYFEHLQELERKTNSAQVTKAKERLLRFVTLGAWDLGGRLPDRNRQRTQE